MPGLAEEIKKNVNRPVPELLPIADDTDVVEVKSGNGSIVMNAARRRSPR